jgi:hypothetical protein
MGLMLVLTGIGFKLAVVPFQLWTPDVYEGAPLPVTAFIATVSKAGMFAFLLRWFHVHDVGVAGAPGLVLTIIAIASMLTGNLLALAQTNVKRILAFSSIAHMGYLLVALLAGGPLGAPAATYYLHCLYSDNPRRFGLMTVLSGPRYEAASNRRLSWTFLEEADRRRCIHHNASFTCRNSDHSGLPRQVLRHRGRRFAVPMGASLYARRQQHHRFVLLSAHHRRHVLPTGRSWPRGSVIHTAFASPSYFGACGSHRSHLSAGRLPRTTLGSQHGCHSRPRMIYGKVWLARVFALDVVLELFDCMVLRESHPVHKISD